MHHTRTISCTLLISLPCSPSADAMIAHIINLMRCNVHVSVRVWDTQLVGQRQPAACIWPIPTARDAIHLRCGTLLAAGGHCDSSRVRAFWDSELMGVIVKAPRLLPQSLTFIHALCCVSRCAFTFSAVSALPGVISFLCFFQCPLLCLNSAPPANPATVAHHLPSYPGEAHKFEKRLAGLLEMFKTLKLPPEVTDR